MSSFSGFKPTQWSDGSPAIDIAKYNYSEQGCKDILTKLARLEKFQKAEITTGLDTYIADCTINGENLTLHMDNWTCSIAFKSESVRDEFLNWLLNGN